MARRTVPDLYMKLEQRHGARSAEDGIAGSGSESPRQPTLCTGVRNTMRIAQGEGFWPVLSVMPFLAP